MTPRKQLRKIVLLLIGLVAVVTANPVALMAQVRPAVAIREMGRGINVGNTLEPPREGGWNNGPLQEYYFDDYRDAGFATVRIPVRWDEHTGRSAPFAVADSWMNRVEQVVDWGLQRGLYIIINGHHEDWLKEGYGNASLRARYDSIWVQIAERFRDKPDRLVFEIINEPFGMSVPQVDDLNSRILSIIRKTNPTRLVIFSGNEYSGADQLISAAVPDPDDEYLLAYFHSYNPWDFGGEAEGTWGTESDRRQLADEFKRVADWSDATGIPVMISEFGAVRQADYNSRMYHYASYVEEALLNGFAFQVWDDGGNFEIYERDERTWNEIKDILIRTYPEGPTRLNVQVVEDSLVLLSWENRPVPITGISVERSLNGREFAKISDLSAGSTRFIDSTLVPGFDYYYRVIAHFATADDRYSYPVTVYVTPISRSSFNGAPAPVPGVIEAEDYDVGGEGLTYHDTDRENVSGAYRPDEAVDIEERADGGFQVAYVETGEWIEYTVNVEEAGEYTISAEVASLEGGGGLQFEFAGRKARVLTIPKTGSWQTTTTVSRTLDLTPGDQVMRVTVTLAKPFNIDRFVIERSISSAAHQEEPLSLTPVDIYPNPAHSYLTISRPSRPEAGALIEVFDVRGRRAASLESSSSTTLIRMDEFGPGLYSIRISEHGRLINQQLVLVH
jgi:hypothetical protein